MNITQPMGPRNNMITNQPIRGLNGQRASGGIRHGPADGLNATCAMGARKPKIKTVQASQTDIPCASVCELGIFLGG